MQLLNREGSRNGKRMPHLGGQEHKNETCTALIMPSFPILGSNVLLSISTFFLGLPLPDSISPKHILASRTQGSILFV